MDSTDILTQDTSAELSSRQTRKVPNLKGLRDMIKKNTPSTIYQQHQSNSQQQRVMKNDSECSFTLTDDEDRENADYNGKKVGTKAKKNGSSKGRSITGRDQLLNRDILGSHYSMNDNRMTESELIVGKVPFQEADENNDEDRFLKELEKENKLLEEELKNLQKSASNTSLHQ